jgi:acetolactate synthase-1/2/3 large subunit
MPKQITHGRIYRGPSSSPPRLLGGHGVRCTDPRQLDAAIREMIETPNAVVFDCVADQTGNCLPMIPSGKAHNEHNEMILPGEAEESDSVIDDSGQGVGR